MMEKDHHLGPVTKAARCTITGPWGKTHSNRTFKAAVIALILLFIWWYTPVSTSTLTGHLPCQSLPGASDVLVVMKTGVTELADRLPPHLTTTLRCPPHTVIYSDHEELYDGKWQIQDVLKNINPEIRRLNSDFALWRHVQKVGREGLSGNELTGTRTTSITTSDDKTIVDGWVLDKWKFLAMMNETYYAHPDKNWYIFMESDTYIFWSTILKYLSTMDHTQPHCLGHRTTYKADYEFMQGGSGYVLSNAALRRAVHYIQAHTEELDRFLETQWAGDIALGYVLNEARVPLTYSWPIFQPSYYGVVDFGLMNDGRRYWCYPAASFHHVTPESIEDLWNMEQKWIAAEDDRENPYKFLRLADIFNKVILPSIRFAKADWNNQSKQVKKDIATIEDCKQACVSDETCLQYSFDTVESICRTSRIPKSGEAALDSGMFSDWIFDRVERWRNDQPSCIAEGFLYFGDVDEDL